MKNIFKTIIIILLIGLTFCSDDSIPTDKSFDFRDYLPLDSGNSWQYEYYAIDSEGSNYSAPFGRETLLATDSTQYLGRSATKMEFQYVNNGNTSDRDFLYSKDSNQIAISGLEIRIHDSLAITEDRWVTLYDLDQYTGPWINNQIKFNDTIIGDSQYFGTINVEGTKGVSTRIEYEGERFEAFSSKLILYFNIERKRNQDTVFITKREEYEYRFAEDIGIVYTYFKQYQDTNFLSGNKKILIDR
jgi:hypothetical protein